jgi:NTE family protein
MLRALTAAVIRPDFVVGASVGAINPAYFAADPTSRGVAQLERIWGSIRRRDVFPVSPVRVLARLLTRRDHILTQEALRHLLEARLPYQRLEDARIPCHIVTTDLLTGTEVRLTEGSVVEALIATTAVPSVFPPVPLAGRLLVDRPK